jgi:hypothetical protein
MKYFEKYVNTKTYMFPNGALATPEVVLDKFPASVSFVHVVETDANGEVMFAFQNLSAMRTIYGIEGALSEADAITALQTAINAEPEYTASAEERIAAALEYQNLVSLTDTTTTS